MPRRTAPDKHTSEGGTITEERTPTAMDRAAELVATQRQVNTLDARLTSLKKKLDKLRKQVLTDIEEGRIPASFTEAGASVHIKRQVWAGPAEDHADLTSVLDELGLDELKPSTVNAQRLSGFVREHLDPDDTLPLEDRLLSDNPKPLDPRLYAALKVTEKIDVGITGAGNDHNDTETQ